MELSLVEHISLLNENPGSWPFLLPYPSSKSIKERYRNISNCKKGHFYVLKIIVPEDRVHLLVRRISPVNSVVGLRQSVRRGTVRVGRLQWTDRTLDEDPTGHFCPPTSCSGLFPLHLTHPVYPSLGSLRRTSGTS